MVHLKRHNLGLAPTLQSRTNEIVGLVMLVSKLCGKAVCSISYALKTPLATRRITRRVDQNVPGRASAGLVSTMAAHDGDPTAGTIHFYELVLNDHLIRVVKFKYTSRSRRLAEGSNPESLFRYTYRILHLIQFCSQLVVLDSSFILILSVNIPPAPAGKRPSSNSGGPPLPPPPPPPSKTIPTPPKEKLDKGKIIKESASDFVPIWLCCYSGGIFKGHWIVFIPSMTVVGRPFTSRVKLKKVSATSSNA